MQGKIEIKLGIRPIEPGSLGQVITAVQNKILELKNSYPLLEISTGAFEWVQEVV